jgi:hypothetical protein
MGVSPQALAVIHNLDRGGRHQALPLGTMDPSDVVPASPEEVLATLRRCAAAGPFFVVEHVVEHVEPARGHGHAGGQAGWLPANALLERGAEPAAVIESVRRWASDTRPRVAASLFLMSYAARLLSASVAGVLLGGVLLDLRAHEWRYRPGSGLQLRLPVPAGWRPTPPSGPDTLLPALVELLVDGRLADTIAAVRSAVPVSEGLLWGNVASSIAGALQSLAAAELPGADGAVVGVRRCREVGEALLATRHLRGAGAFVGTGLAFRRRSCCLFYLLPASGKCADCALLR